MMSHQSPRAFVFLLALLCLGVVTTWATFAPHPQNFTPHVTNNIAPLSQVSLIFHGRGDKSIQSLSTNDFSTSSMDKPNDENVDEFYPFGKSMTFSFTTTPVSTQRSSPLATTSAESTTHEFNLQIDELTSPISISASKPSVLNINTQDNNSPTAQTLYAKHTVFSGKRIDAETGLEETIILTILPNAGDFTSDRAQATSPELESQSISGDMNPLTFNPLSTDAYTIEGYIFKQSGQVVHVQSFSSLIHQQKQTKLALKEQREHGTVTADEGDRETDAMLSQSLDALSAHIELLEELQAQSDYDLAVYTLDLKQSGTCGTAGAEADHPHSHSASTADSNKDIDAEAITSPLAQLPQWVLAPWTISPATRNTASEMYVSAYASLSYSLYASDTTSTSQISIDKVKSRLALLFALVNQPYFQQLRIIWRITSFEIRTEKSDEPWNVTADKSDVRCTVPWAETLLDDFGRHRTSDLKYQQSSLNHLFIHCTPAAGAYVAGIHYMNGSCQKHTASGWTMMMNPTNFITTTHELGHSLGVPHPFRSSDQVGSFGGIMDYVYQRLPDFSKLSTADKRMYGFNFDTDFSHFFRGISTMRQFQGYSVLVPTEHCYKEITLNIDATKGVTSSTCGNGIQEPWEECDVDSACCIDCKLKAGATCAIENECCVDCGLVDANIHKCALEDGTRAGYCYRGKCVPMSYPQHGPTLADIAACPDEMNFGYSNFNDCGYALPRNSQCQASDYIDRDQMFQHGTRCMSRMTKKSGICVPINYAFNDPNAVVSSCEANIYTWKWVKRAACNCAAGDVTETGMVTCHDLAGFIVSSSFCALSPHPSAPACDCVKREYRYGEWSVDCGNASCGNVGIKTRTASCFVKDEEVDLSECQVSIGYPITMQECEYEAGTCDNDNNVFCEWNLGSTPYTVCMNHGNRRSEDNGKPPLKWQIVVICILVVLLLVCIGLCWWKKVACFKSFGQTGSSPQVTETGVSGDYVNMDRPEQRFNQPASFNPPPSEYSDYH